MAYRDSVGERPSRSVIAGGLERPGEQRAPGLQQELEGRRRDLVRGRAVLVRARPVERATAVASARGWNGAGSRRAPVGDDAAPVVEPPTLRRCQRPRVPLAQLARARAAVAWRVEPHRLLRGRRT